jgi:hypothetical protein
MIAYEIQTLRENVWRISAVLDDRETAIFEAKRIGASERLDVVRVVEESFDESTDLVANRTIFRMDGQPDSHRDAAPPRALASNDEMDTLHKAVQRSIHNEELQREKGRRQHQRAVRQTALLIFGGLVLGFIAIVLIDKFS